MTAVKLIGRASFFYQPSQERSAALPAAQTVIDRARALRPGINLLVGGRGLPARVAVLEPERLANIIAPQRLPLAQGIVEFIHALGNEVRDGDYYLDALVEQVAKLPDFASPSRGLLQSLYDLCKKGVNFSDLPEGATAAGVALQSASRELRISAEYLAGSLQKTVQLMRLLGVRNRTVNLSNLFHNFHNGHLTVSLAEASGVDSTRLLERAQALEAKGETFEIFKDGSFDRKVTALSSADLDQVIAKTAEDYRVSEAEVRKFIDIQLAVEEKRLAAAPVLSLRELAASFKFSASEEAAVALAPVAEVDDPNRWRGTELGIALRALRKDINWLVVSAGVRAAGKLKEFQRNRDVTRKLKRITTLADGYAITLVSGRDGRAKVNQIRELSEEHLLFDLYCLAVLNKKSLMEVIDAALATLRLIRQLENRDPIVALDELIAARLKGESFATLLGTQGIVLRDAPLTVALEKLRGLGDKTRFTVRVDGDRDVPLREVGIDQFRRAVTLMGRGMRPSHSPERVLGAMMDRVVPEIAGLPAKVIDNSSPHDLGRVVEMAIEGVPARYPLRRPWTKVDLDRFAFMGSGLAPGIRNCLGCPVNVLHGTVVKTAAAMGFDEMIEYEATGCKEVFTGIFPFTGNTLPTLHGVFGGAPSEMMGGLAAKRARVKYAIKMAIEIAQIYKVLHLGWAGDGGTFDIGRGNLIGLVARLQKLHTFLKDLVGDELAKHLVQRALYVCYDNEGYQNTGNQYSSATPPGMGTTTYPEGEVRPMGSDIRKSPIVEEMATLGVALSARMGIHRPEHIARVTARALIDGESGAFLHFLQPCTTGWKFTADSIAHDLSWLAEDGGLFPPVTIEHGVAYLEVYPTRRSPEDAFLKMQSRFRHLLGSEAPAKRSLSAFLAYYRWEWERNLRLTGFEGELPEADRFGYLESEHRRPKFNVLT